MKRIFNTDTALLLWRLLMVYVVLAICRVAFALYNLDTLGEFTPSEIADLLHGASVFDTASMLYLNLPFIVLSLLPLRIRHKPFYLRTLLWLYMLTGALIVVSNLADAIYFHYTLKRFTADELLFADNSNSLLLVGKFAVENWYMTVTGVALIVILRLCYRYHITPTSIIGSRVWRGVVSTLLLVAAVVLGIGGIRGGFARTTRPITLSNATAYTTDINKANLILSNPFCIIRTLGGKHTEYPKTFDKATLDSIYTPVHTPTPESDTLPDLSGRNLVVIIMESFSAEHSALLFPELYPDGQGYTPFLDSLMRHGLYFTHGMANGHKSIEAMPAVLGSIPSLETPFVLLPQSLGESRQLPSILASEGYNTMFFCGSPRGSMGFGAYARSAGIQTLYGQEDYEKVDGKGDFDGYWGIWDEEFLQFFGQTLSQSRQPFLASLFTISSHHPFVVPERYRQTLPEGKTKIHRGVAYTDMSIRRMFEQYGGCEWFRNSVFVFVADHVSSEKYAPQTHTASGSCRIVEFIYTPDEVLRGRIDTPVQQIDLMPTILGLFRYDKPYFAYGRDIFDGSTVKPTICYTTSAMQFVSTMNDHTAMFDGRHITRLYAPDDVMLENPLAPDDFGDTVAPWEQYLQAFTQQYYSHLEQKNYTVEAQ